MPSLLNWFDHMLRREQQHSVSKAPLLDRMLPILEYSPEQLQRGDFFDDVLTAGILAYGKIAKAAQELAPLGIHDSDLCLLLQARMKEQLKRQKSKLPKRKSR
jgi:hypothetical protein